MTWGMREGLHVFMLDQPEVLAASASNFEEVATSALYNIFGFYFSAPSEEKTSPITLKHEYHTVIDLTISNSGLNKCKTAAHSSDHAAVFINYHADAPLPGKKHPLAYANWQNTDKEAFGEALRSNINASKVPFPAKGDVQRMYDALEEAVDTAFKMSTPTPHQTPHSKPWWNKDLSALNKDIREAHVCLKDCISKFRHGSVPVVNQAHIWCNNCNLFKLTKKSARN
ncbi:hypothetical protein BOTBODRAFT_43014 [Botryobasidium botryosum FD-172 SS1]|uniref:Endonuclease/exonuclease/phosphatase domain-containing protein n=1 Tax=Botryobasidium botryosum (strain FD-172 SS1) TaxID=930990 RepID=A0A067MZS7_BOTB1|nr:hypothetical protein BOTBODRAFT_43014 [Botryobasidium botryosum FD-172 SS1]